MPEDGPGGIASHGEDWIRQHCDVSYLSFGNVYGISTRELAAALEKSDAVVWVSNFDAIAALKELFPNAQAIWISRDFDEDRVRGDLNAWGEYPEAVDLRIRAARRAEDDFAKHAALFEVVVSNNGDFAWLKRQLEGALITSSVQCETLFDQSPQQGVASGSDIVVVSAFLEKRLFAEKPERLFQLSARQFEEFVASLLADEGYEVELTRPSRDGGYDIVAVRRGLAVPQLCLVECKRYSRERPVGVQPVRQLHGVASQVRASAALLVTTSRFTAGADEFRQKLAYQIGFRDYMAIVAALARYR